MQRPPWTPLHGAVDELQREWEEQLRPAPAGTADRAAPQTPLEAEAEQNDVDMQRALALSLAGGAPGAPEPAPEPAVHPDTLLREEQDAAYAAAIEAELRRRQAAPARTESVRTPAAACPCEPGPGQPAVRLRIQLYTGDSGTHAFAPTALVSDIVRWAQHRLQRTTPMTVFDPIRKRALDPARTLAWHGLGAAQVVRVLCAD